MNLSDAVALIRPAVPVHPEKSVWADLGCGTGTFTNALASLLGKGSKIYAMDKVKQLQSSSPSLITEVEFIKVDIEVEPLQIPCVDGIVMANVLHYIKDQLDLLRKIRASLKPEGIVILVEYDRDHGNTWVPYPVSLQKANIIFPLCGFEVMKKIGERRSVFGSQPLYACFTRPVPMSSPESSIPYSLVRP